jgi:hypothetical protein
VLQLWAKCFPEALKCVAVVSDISINAADPLLYILFIIEVYLTALSVVYAT